MPLSSLPAFARETYPLPDHWAAFAQARQPSGTDWHGVDWSGTLLGPRQNWSASLKSAVQICLDSAVPTSIMWGPHLAQVCNDAYCRAWHPGAQPPSPGQCWRDSWLHAWPAMRAGVGHALSGSGVYAENIQVPMPARGGHQPEAFATLSLTPIMDKPGEVLGIHHTLVETTALVQAGRRARMLAALADSLALAADEVDVAHRTATALRDAGPDALFVLFYAADDVSRGHRLAAASRIAPGDLLAPEHVPLGVQAPWPLCHASVQRRPLAAQARHPSHLMQPAAGLQDAAIAGEAAPDAAPPQSGVLLPIRLPDQHRSAAVIVIGLAVQPTPGDAQATFLSAIQETVTHAMSAVRSRADERRHIARDLHDLLGQHLAALSMSIKAQSAQPGAIGQAERTQQLARLIEAADRDLDRIMLDLRASPTCDDGLAPALESHVRTWQRLFNQPVDLLLRMRPEPMPPAVETAVLRVVQEALTNIARHAEARHVSVMLEQTTRELRGSIEDDGVGFDPRPGHGRQCTPGADDGHDTCSGGTQWGLVGMRERMQALGGRLDLESRPGAGTTVLFCIPLRPPCGG